MTITPLKALKAAKSRGLTLIEALLFLGLAALVIVGAVTIYNNASNSTRTNEALSQIQTYATGVKGLNSGSSQFTNNADFALPAIRSGVAPKNAVVGGTSLVNPWGGATTITGRTSFFTISMAGVPQESCVRLLTSGLMNQGGIVGMSVAAAATAIPTTSAGTNFAVATGATLTQATTACAAATNQINFFVR